MKGLIYLGLILVFIMFFNTNPMIALVVLGCMVVVFLFIRRKKSNTSGNFSSGIFSFRKGSSQQNSSLDTYLKLMMLQQMNASKQVSFSTRNNTNKEGSKREEIERQKQETLKLLKSEEDL